MSATRPRKSSAPPIGISFQQVVGLAIDDAQHRLQRMLTLYEENDDLGEEVSDIDYALRVGFERLERMRTIEIKNYSDFDHQWFGVAAILKMSLKVLDQQDTYYGRLLLGASAFFDQMRSTVEFVDVRNLQSLQRAA